MANGAFEDAPLPGERGVNRVKPGHLRWGINADVEPPGSGKPAQFAVEDKEHKETEPEYRNTRADQRDETRNVVRPAIVANRGDDAERHPEQRRVEHREERQLERGRNEIFEVIRDGVTSHNRFAHVTAQ